MLSAGQAYGQYATEQATFNSLFEMPDATCQLPKVRIVGVLSILYLRCPTTDVVDSGVVYLGLFSLSILYLRCPCLLSHLRYIRLRITLSILYLRCQLKAVRFATHLNFFQFSI